MVRTLLPWKTAKTYIDQIQLLLDKIFLQISVKNNGTNFYIQDNPTRMYVRVAISCVSSPKTAWNEAHKEKLEYQYDVNDYRLT